MTQNNMFHPCNMDVSNLEFNTLLLKMLNIKGLNIATDISLLHDTNFVSDSNSNKCIMDSGGK